MAELPPISKMLAARLSKAGVRAGNVIVKVKTPSFELITRRMPLLRPTGDAAILSRVSARIIETKLGPLQGASCWGYRPTS